MRLSRRSILTRNGVLRVRVERLLAERDDAREDACALTGQLLRVSGELSRAKDVIASHIVAAGHPSTVLHDPKAFAEALRQALADAGVDIRIELARLEGVDL